MPACDDCDGLGIRRPCGLQASEHRWQGHRRYDGRLRCLLARPGYVHSMISFRHFALRRGSRLLLSDIDLVIQSGWRLGVIGRNGCGKSSLFAALQGRLESDAGELEMSGKLRLASVAQETPALPDAAIDYVLGGD